jgi:hypothetical protein
MRTCFLLSFFLSLAAGALAQTNFAITEGKPAQVNGLEYGYNIRNESKKDVGSKGTYSRFEVTVYVTNNSGCPKIVLLNNNILNGGSNEANAIARFDCINATGMRLTAKQGTVRAKEFYVNVEMPVITQSGKTTTELRRVFAGYILKNGESVSNNLIFIVPLNERPDVKVTPLGRNAGDL